MKFGGTSVQDAEAIARVREIVRGRLDERPLVVVSAMARVTRVLCTIAEAARNADVAQAEELLNDLLLRHHGVAEELLADDADLFVQTVMQIDDLWEELAAFVEDICARGRVSDCDEARIISTGELLSSVIVSAALNAGGLSCTWLDAREMIVTDENYLSARPDLAQTCANVQAALQGKMRRSS